MRGNAWQRGGGSPRRGLKNSLRKNLRQQTTPCSGACQNLPANKNAPGVEARKRAGTLARGHGRAAKAPQTNALLLRGLFQRALDQFQTAFGAFAQRPVELALGLARSEEHTSELQSRLHLVCRLLLEKKKKTSVS